MNLVLLGALFVMFTTTVGSFLALFFRKLPEWGLDVSMAFSGGIMLVASFTSLILPAVDEGGVFRASLGVLLGFFLIMFVERKVPHAHVFMGYEGSQEYRDKLRKIWLIVMALIIHNFPEGFAVGVSIVNDSNKGMATALAIGIQDIPEGLAVSLPLMVATKRVVVPLFVGFLSGFSEFLTALVGGWAFTVMKSFLPFGLSMAGGAMVYVTVKEVFPEAYRSGRDTLITCGFLAGFLVMLILDTLLG